jgi:hypothetical protein
MSLAGVQWSFLFFCVLTDKPTPQRLFRSLACICLVNAVQLRHREESAELRLASKFYLYQRYRALLKFWHV